MQSTFLCPIYLRVWNLNNPYDSTRLSPLVACALSRGASYYGPLYLKVSIPRLLGYCSFGAEYRSVSPTIVNRSYLIHFILNFKDKFGKDFFYFSMTPTSEEAIESQMKM